MSWLLLLQEVYITGGHINYDVDKGNVFTIPSNEYSEFNFFLDPTAADLVLSSGLNITLIPLNVQRKVSYFHKILKKLKLENRTPEARFSRRLLSRLYHLKQKHHQYDHVVKLLNLIILYRICFCILVNQAVVSLSFFISGGSWIS